MAIFVCETCNSRFVQDTYPPPRHECFKCHVKGVRLGFRHGKEDFHGDTIKQRQEKILADAKKNGINAVPASEYGI